jgi:hypothetical protein
MLAPLFFLLKVLAREVLSELTAINLRPRLVYLPVTLPAELQLLIVGLPGEDDGVDVQVFGVTMERVDDGAFRKVFLLML